MGRGPSRSTRPPPSRTPRAARSTASSSTRSPPVSAAWSCAPSRSMATRSHDKVHDQTVIVPLGGILPAGATAKVRVQYRSTLRSSLTGSNWLFTKVNGIVDAYRWIPWVSLDTPFNRPNHGDPFVTPGQPVGEAPGRDRPAARHRLDGRPRAGVVGRPDPVVRGQERAGRHDHRGARLPVTVRAGRLGPGSLLLPVLGERGDDPRRGCGCRAGLPVASRPVPVRDLQGRPVVRRLRHGVAAA